MTDGKKIAVVLSGGAAKGSMQFGMLKYLVEQGLKPDALYGTSVGNLNAMGYSYIGIEGLERFWAGIKSKSSVFKFNLLSLVFLAKGLYNAKPLRKLVEAVIEEGKEPKIPCYSCVVDLQTGEIKYGKGGDPDYVDYVVASASIPAVTDPVGTMVDGGVREQSPLKKAIEDGADKIIVILCNPWRKDPDPEELGNWFKNLVITTSIMSHEVFLNDVEECIWYNEHKIDGKRPIELEVYAPERLVIDSDDFVQEKIQPAIKYGYEQAKNGPVLTWKL